MLSGSGSNGSTKISREQAASDAGFVNKTAQQIHGAVLFTYTVALLGLLGALRGQTFKASALAGMYGSDTVITHHRKQGNIEAVKRGYVRLTTKGMALFNGRAEHKISGQRIEGKDVAAMVVAIKTSPSLKIAQDSAIVRQINWRKVGETK
jgi:hypothetical protein